MALDKLTKQNDQDPRRLRVSVRGAVQGVGFRPFVYRLASQLQLAGWVSNSPHGVTIEVEGMPGNLESFLLRIERERPPSSFIQSLESSYLGAQGFSSFEIRESNSNGAKTAVILPDIATCPDCLGDVFDPDNRRYLYPFTNCTNCGPRYSIVEALPYDRHNTTMKGFEMCTECRREYEDPTDRRFHAQPNACPKCGPHLELWNTGGESTANGHDALLSAAEALRQGRIVAVKGIGGFHLMVDARNTYAVNMLRKRKHREEKPLALMLSSVEEIEGLCDVSPLEKRVLTSSERPIMILKIKGSHGPISPLVAPDNPYLGCVLPYSPLHHLLMRELGFPLVATSGNLSNEPICIDEKEAVARLHNIADLFLVHDRPIKRHVDDSIVRVMAGREAVIRRARGFAPLPVPSKISIHPMLAVGAHLKNSIAASTGHQSFISQHIGDLETPEALKAFRMVINDLEDIYEISPNVIACDEHPDYLSTRFARDSGINNFPVQHHYAHVLSCMAENELDAPALGVAWDGTGYGDDGTIWGGEFLKISKSSFTREGHFRTFPLPGGDTAVRQPRRVAMGVLYETFGDRAFTMPGLIPVHNFDPGELAMLKNMVAKDINSPQTSSVGRLFDAVASIIGIKQFVGYEGQAAMKLEFAIGALRTDEHYDFDLIVAAGEPAIVDWRPVIDNIVADVRSGVRKALISARFHNMLVESIVQIAHHVGEPSVVMSGGCFQNKYLLERAVERLREEGFRPYWHQRVPTNDGGIALGQTLAAARSMLKSPRNEKIIERRANALCV